MVETAVILCDSPSKASHYARSLFFSRYLEIVNGLAFEQASRMGCEVSALPPTTVVSIRVSHIRDLVERIVGKGMAQGGE